MSSYGALPEESSDGARKPTLRNTLIVLFVAATAFLVTGLVLGVTAADEIAVPLRERITIAPMVATWRALQNIADETGNRATGFPGYDMSVEYLLNQLKQHTPDYNVETQKFPVQISTEIEPSYLAALDAQDQVVHVYDETEFGGAVLQGSGNVVAPVTEVKSTTPDNCTAADWVGFPRGNIAVVARSPSPGVTCRFAQLAQLCVDHGAAGCIIYNARGQELVVGGAGQPRAIPVFGVTYAVSRELIGGAARARMTSNVQVRDVESTNICAETKRGEANAVVIMGSHLDGVPAGPGINDDGSGTAANLAIAIATYQELKDKTVNKIRFCWWGAEENGLLGSRAYVQMLKAENRLSAVALNINMDMVASPNYFYGIHNATSADPSVSPIAVLGSRRVQQALEGAMRAINEVYDLSPFTGRSDYGPFLEESIPAGGVETGAEERKTEAQRAKFGGVVGVAFDPCYHKACDSFDNPSRTAQLVMTQAAAGGLQSLAMQKDLRQFLTRPF